MSDFFIELAGKYISSNLDGMYLLEDVRDIQITIPSFSNLYSVLIFCVVVPGEDI
jgi:hypothetical protein